jgi:glucosyl-3-phosphoglycerate synthase
MQPDARRWFLRRTFAGDQTPPVEVLLARKGAQRVSVVLPARNEEATVGGVVAAVVPLLGSGLVDELIVLDGSSTDRTAAVAAEAGATVIPLTDVLPSYGTQHGKGEALWKALYVTDGDLIVYLDADLLEVTSDWVSGLLWPLLTEPDISLVKACYERPLALPGRPEIPGGGRVTELTARPLLNHLWPQLAGIIQPLAGEYAARRSLLEQIPYDAGYAVELGLLLDTLDEVGLDGIAQVHLGVRRHRHQSTEALGRMAAAITSAALKRAGVAFPGTELVQFTPTSEGFIPVETPTGARPRPPMIDIPEYASPRVRAS